MRNLRTSFLGVALVAVMMAAFSGCASGTAGSATGSRSVYALLPQGTDQPYGTQYLKAMKAEAAKDHINLTITNSQYDPNKQASDCQVAVAAKPALIILWPAVADAVRPCLERAQAAHIPVTVTNSDVLKQDQPLTAGYSGPDTYGQGAAAAQMMCKLAGSKPTKIIQVAGLTGNSTAINREAGFEDTVKKNCPNVKILATQPGNWDKNTSETVTSEMITSVGASNVQGIYAADDTMVAGAIAALQSRGINPKPLDIVSIGNTTLGNPLVKAGLLDGTVFQSSAWDGQHAITLANEVLSGKKPSPREEFMPSVEVTQANASSPSVAPNW